MLSVTCTAPVNIAVIKYWGKRDEELVLPINGSLSATLDQSQLRAKTSIIASKQFEKDRMWLNGEEQSVDTSRLQNVLRDVRRRARKRNKDGECAQNGSMLNWHLHICSENNFPTAAGLASSAAGYACLAFTLAKLYKIQEDDVSLIARQGSGSACRSVHGGFVEWHMGTEPDGSDSFSTQFVSQEHWPEMRLLILVVSAKKKHVSSAAGMKNCVKTSQLLKYRASSSVPERLKQLKCAIEEKNFASFAELTMKDSNEMHACCLDTYPPISYMTDVSRQIQTLVHHINNQHPNPIVAYTFDAGPNACLFLLEENVPEVLSYVKHCFQSHNESKNFVTGLDSTSCSLSEGQTNKLPVDSSPGAVQYVIYTKLGPGPQVLDESESLFDSDGMPKSAQ